MSTFLREGLKIVALDLIEMRERHGDFVGIACAGGGAQQRERGGLHGLLGAIDEQDDVGIGKAPGDLGGDARSRFNRVAEALPVEPNQLIRDLQLFAVRA